jgi:outer membrane protein TolC
VELALSQSLTLQKNAIDLADDKYEANHLWSELFPSISASAGVNYRSNLFTGEGFQFKESGLGYSLSMGITLSLKAGLPYAMKLISLAYQSRLLTYEDARRQLEIQVAKDFYKLIAEQERLALRQESLDLAEKQRDKSRVAFQNGIIPQREYLQSQLSVETTKGELRKDQISYASSLRAFFTLLGLDSNTEVTLEGTIEIARINADPERLILTYLAKRPDIIKQRQTIEELEYKKRQTALNGRAPSLSLSAQWGGSGSGDPASNFGDTLSGSVTLSIPIDPWIPGTETSQSIRRAGSEVEKAKLDLQEKENDAKNQIRSLTADLQNSWNTIETSQLRVQIAEQTYQLTEQAFQMGAVEFTILETTRNDLSKARQQLLDDELAYKVMMLDLAGALNLDWKAFVGSML